jgi:hypothetical protein
LDVRSSTQSREGAKKNNSGIESSGRVDARPFFCTIWCPLRLRDFASRFSPSTLLEPLTGALDRFRYCSALALLAVIPAPPGRSLPCPFALKAGGARFMASAVLRSSLHAFSVRPGLPGVDHRDAVHRAGRQAQAATGAFGRDHGMHQPGSADDGVHGAGFDAQRAADARLFINHGNRRGFGSGFGHDRASGE